MRLASTLAVMVALTGCSTFQQAPDPASAPSLVVPNSWGAGTAAPVAPQGNWVAGFADPEMEALVLEALAQNPGLASSYERVRASEANIRSVYGRSLPSVTGGATAGYSSSVFDAGTGPSRVDGSNLDLSLSSNWEVDFWGRVASGIAATQADLIASEADFEAARLSVAARTALAWVDLNEAVRLEELARETLAARERILLLTERRLRIGLSSALDVRLARSAVATARSTILFRQQLTGEAGRRIEILLGRYPANALVASGEIATLVPLEAIGSPTLLLARRPDVNAAEARIVAAGFRADQARAALKPVLSLSATLSTSTDNLGDLIDPDFLAGRVVSGLTAPLFRGGALRADIDAAEATARQAAYLYVSTVLQAWQEVENSLAADAFLADRVIAEEQALEEARLAETLAERQYQNGLTSIFNLIDAQTRRINAQGSLISARADRVTNRIQFYLSLGGDVVGPETPSSDLLEGFSL